VTRAEPPGEREEREATDFEFVALEGATNYRAALLGEFAAVLRGRVLELGAGTGNFSAALATFPAVEEVVSVEPEPRFCETFRQRHPGNTLHQGTLESLGDDWEWDAAISINVLEHVKDDERELLQLRKRLDRRGGHLCLFVPARQEIYAPIDGDFGHHRRYAAPELRGKLERAGFRVERLHYFNWIGYFTWWFVFRLLRKRHFGTASVLLFDRVVFPPMHGFERRVMRPPFGQSLLAICRPSS